MAPDPKLKLKRVNTFLRPVGRNHQQIPLFKNKMPDWLFHVAKVGSDLDLLLNIA
jgi:hypothetical protein